jgi:hypothetical protein
VDWGLDIQLSIMNGCRCLINTTSVQFGTVFSGVRALDFEEIELELQNWSLFTIHTRSSNQVYSNIPWQLASVRWKRDVV